VNKNIEYLTSHKVALVKLKNQQRNHPKIAENYAAILRSSLLRTKLAQKIALASSRSKKLFTAHNL
jgi:hypothetical protein